jgi:hypothetical protein
MKRIEQFTEFPKADDLKNYSRIARAAQKGLQQLDG